MGRKKLTDSKRVNMFFDFYKECWSKHYGVWLGRFTGRERTKTKTIIASVGLDDLKKRLKRFFEDDNDWLRKRCHPLSVFLVQVNNYAGMKNEKEEQTIAKHKTFNVQKELEKRNNRKDVGI